MPGMTWMTLLNSPLPLAAGTPLTNSTTATDISPGPHYPLPASFMQNGSALSFIAWGVFSSVAATPGTLTLGIYYGGVAGTALATCGTPTLPTSAANWTWRLRLDTTIWTTGTAGTASSQGECFISTSLTSLGTPLAMPATAQTTVAIDTTAAKPITVGATFGTANASNSITCRQLKIYSDGL